LVEAISRPWVCTNIRHLELTVGIPDMPLGGPNNDTPYYLRAPPLVLSTNEEAVFGRLRLLYQQIGALKELRYLDLRAEKEMPGHEHLQKKEYEETSFPLLMSLGDKRTGRKGYLALLGGLSKLRVLRGSVYLDKAETRETVGLREAVWMDTAFPALEKAEFFYGAWSVEPSEPFLWLKKQRGGALNLKYSG
jgi:hypothetical protein